MKVKTIIQEKAERAGKRFAEGINRPTDDPIVVNLIHDLKMTFGKIARKNRIEAERAAKQPSLFSRSKA